MVTHTLVFSFPDQMSDADRDQFFSEGSALILDSGLVESYEHKRSIPVASDVNASAFVASAIARARCADLDTMRKFFAYPPLIQFVRRWQDKFPYDVVWVNTED